MKYSVDSGAVSQAALQARSTSGIISTEVGAMMGHLMTLNTSWTGAAALNFDDLIHRWRALQTQVELNLDEISIALDTAATTYADSEMAAARMFAG